MYEIAQTEIQAVNGIGDTPAEPAAAKSGIDWTSVINTGLQVGGEVAQTAIDANNPKPNSSGSSDNNAGYNPSTYSPGTINVTSKKKDTDYMPWIIGGVAAVALIAVLMMGNNNKRR